MGGLRTFAGLFVSVAVCACIGGGTTESPKSIEPPAGPYIHAGSSMEFPQEIGSFTRTEITQYDGSGEDVSVAYPDQVHSIATTVYVYPGSEETAPGSPPSTDSFEAVKTEVVGVTPEAELIDEGASRTSRPAGRDRLEGKLPI